MGNKETFQISLKYFPQQNQRTILFHFTQYFPHISCGDMGDCPQCIVGPEVKQALVVKQ